MTLFPEYYSRRYDPYDDFIADPPELARELRVPLLTSEYPRWNYITGIVVRDEEHFEAGVMPTDDEIRVVGSFLEEYCQHWYRDSFREAMRHFAPYDIDGGANLAYLIKGADGGWHYRKRTWTRGVHWWPDYYHSATHSLVTCLDRLHISYDNALSDRWVAWKAAHPEVFSPDNRPQSTVWNHRRRGRIEGVVIWERGDWVHIRLVGDHRLSYGSESNRGRVDRDGERITVRRSLLEEVTE